ncbi:PA4642 family protein [Gilvimarinus sp. SDUM040013]|uniref:PA4642 family protein n=1 Tax=Gilvimarinus gilvus TaxID=3058038 RepID=A0ABU4RSQ8_9GAMM|nr:PA4642 family protein [Gilvimarinus sp. SDUM040013]MDO3388367.1 PA4642 family protein [Gilvimarinus sp. SDUM040013]MDX6847917.1 PA4642 family protein [Gilvimarinus sp. SDUM040013]
MTLKKDKQKVLGEVFDDERIKSFLEYPAPEGVSPDYHLLEKAYRGMKAENFATFVEFFLSAGYGLNTSGPAGKTFLQTIENHRLSEDYVATLKKAGAE